MLRGNGWGRKHSTVDYVFRYDPTVLYSYHMLVLREKRKRGHTLSDSRWTDPIYRGQYCNPWSEFEVDRSLIDGEGRRVLYKEHDAEYFIECVNNMLGKGIPRSQFYDRDGYFKV